LVEPEASTAFGQRRLAIIDLSPMGHQPMISANGQYANTFNGEIYNFRELRTELERRGVRFRGHSDTEVIVEGFVQWGVKSTIARLNGMFALAALDAGERQLFLARDRMGEKPLYWAIFDGLVLFGSELKAVRAHPGLKHPCQFSLNRRLRVCGSSSGPRHGGEWLARITVDILVKSWTDSRIAR
jgi:asparagine synthase (glutamine-hydrolysing)